jgi:hypothetical protein
MQGSVVRFDRILLAADGSIGTGGADPNALPGADMMLDDRHPGSWSEAHPKVVE